MSMTQTKPTVDRLRYDIDSGRTGDKVAWPDPAAAPLGTDEEAAGTPLSPAHVAHAHAHEQRHPPQRLATNSNTVAVWILVTFIMGFAATMIMTAAII